MTELKMIEALRPSPPEHVGVVVTVDPQEMVEAEVFRAEYLDPAIPGIFSDQDLDLMAAAFVTLVHALPTSPYRMVDWMVTRAAFDPDEIALYAEQKLGMERVETPVRRRGPKRGG